MVKTAQPRTTAHEQFTIERTYDFPVAAVFAAWADGKAKNEWFGGPDGWKDEHRLDFRVGGREWQRTTSPDGAGQFTYNSEYHDIVPDERIVYSYTMDDKERRISASLSTIEFKASGGKTKLVITEADVFFDDKVDGENRKGGTGMLLDSLDRYLKTKS